MLDTSKMSRPEYGPESGELRPVCETLHRAAEIIETADRTPDESVKKPLLEGAKTMLQNVIAAIEGRRTEGLVPCCHGRGRIHTLKRLTRASNCDIFTLEHFGSHNIN